jgi:hypothetical protein
METNLIDTQAFTAGILFSLAVMLCLLLRAVTQDDHPATQRANRLALAGGLLGIVMLAAVNGVIYRYISRPLASFMLFPLILASGAWLLLGMPRLHRYFAGKPQSKPSVGPEVGVEHATRQQQRDSGKNSEPCITSVRRSTENSSVWQPVIGCIGRRAQLNPVWLLRSTVAARSS